MTTLPTLLAPTAASKTEKRRSVRTKLLRLALLPLTLLGVTRLAQVLTSDRTDTLQTTNQILGLYNSNYLERIGDMQDSAGRALYDADIRAMTVLRGQEAMQQSALPLDHVVVTDEQGQLMAATSSDNTTRVGTGEGYAAKQWIDAHPQTYQAAQAAASVIMAQVKAGQPVPPPYVASVQADGHALLVNAQVLPQGNGVSLMFADGAYVQRMTVNRLIQALWPLLLALVLAASYAIHEGQQFAQRLMRFASVLTRASEGEPVEIPVTGNDEIGDAEVAGKRIYTSYKLAEGQINDLLGLKEQEHERPHST